ncbi:unnamed protein product [Phytomonas sp. Hart1]|nr:unnamed protein product [Phytomonas sp. Hart1]|eukprot:CCW71822.1 unnamed protein product [Phytomonas sp. isolate Hart1]
MNAEEYWRLRVQETEGEYAQLIQSQRDEIESLQRRCNELLHERCLMKAQTAMEVRNFVVNFQGEQRGSLSAVDAIPTNVLLNFLHRYSNGLVPSPVNMRKRNRSTDVSSISQKRLHQRLMARKRLREVNETEDNVQFNRVENESGAKLSAMRSFAEGFKGNGGSLLGLNNCEVGEHNGGNVVLAPSKFGISSTSPN